MNRGGVERLLGRSVRRTHFELCPFDLCETRVKQRIRGGVGRNDALRSRSGFGLG